MPRSARIRRTRAGGAIRIALAFALFAPALLGACVSCPAAGMLGTLASRDGVPGLQGDDGSWAPIRVREGLFGYGIRRDPDGFVITGALGEVVAREGDHIEAGGGGGDGEAYLCSGIAVVPSASHSGDS